MADKPIPLSELAIASGSQRHKLFVEAVYKAGNLIELFDFEKDDSLSASAFGIEEEGLPTLGWGKINKQADTILTRTKARTGWAALVRHTMQADVAFLRAWSAGKVKGPGPWSVQTKGFATSWGRKFSNDLINGSKLASGAADPDGFVGFRDMFSNPSEYYIDPSCDIDAGGLDISPDGVSASAGNTLDGLIRRLCHRMGSPNGSDIRLINGIELMAQLESATKTAGLLKTTTDAFGRTIPMWNDAQFHVAGLAPDKTDVLPGYETTAGAIGTDGTNLHSSIFAVNMAEMANWMGGSLEPQDLPQNGVYKEKLVDALFGFLPTSNFWLGRIKNIQVRNSP
jgi:hypothetical protein